VQVLRAGSSSYFSYYYTSPLFIDEVRCSLRVLSAPNHVATSALGADVLPPCYVTRVQLDPTGNVINTFSVPTAASGSNQACTLAVSPDDGFMSLSGDGKEIVWGCYASPLSYYAPFYYSSGAGYYRVAARMRIDGSIDTSSYSLDAFTVSYRCVCMGNNALPMQSCH